MIQLQELIKPTWSAEEWLNTAWSLLAVDEQLYIKDRVDEMFYNDLPFQLEHNRIVYLHLFALLAQLEILALQGLLKTMEKLIDKAQYARMRKQALDKIFHSVVFIKLTNQLSTPYAYPPNHNKEVEQMMDFLFNEQDPNTLLVLLNLVGESWLAEIYSCLQDHNIAANIFAVILADETRHLEGSDDYFQLRLGNPLYLNKKLAALEEELIKLIFSQEKYLVSFINLLSRKGVIQLLHRIDNKHQAALKKIGLSPSKKWHFIMTMAFSLIENFFHEQSQDSRVTETNPRNFLNYLGTNPNNPGQTFFCSLNVSLLGVFEKKYPAELFSCLCLQAISKLAATNPKIRNYRANHKIYNSQKSYLGLVVPLPDCDNQLSLIEFENCHEMTIAELRQAINDDLCLMSYCYKKMQQLKGEHPYLDDLINNFFNARDESSYEDPLFAKPTITLTNLGPWGYDAGISPLLPNETLKFTLAKIERRQVWNNKIQDFEVQDLLPVGITADQRVIDGHLAIPAGLQQAFDTIATASDLTNLRTESGQMDDFIETINELLDNDLEFGYRYLYFASQLWKHGKTQAVFKSRACKPISFMNNI